MLGVNAAELSRTGSAFYFTPRLVRITGGLPGRLAQKPEVTLAHAVIASAAYPMFDRLALDRSLPFDKRDGVRRVERVILTDGGVYDNLGLAPLWPDRDPSVSFNVESIDIIICCRAGKGLRHDSPRMIIDARIKSARACNHDRDQNASKKKLFELSQEGKLRAVVLPLVSGRYDRRLKFRPADFVTREEAYGYPTDFSAMSDAWISRLSRRGEQLTRALIAEHAPDLMVEPVATVAALQA